MATTMLAGAIPAALMALLIHGVFELVDRLLIPAARPVPTALRSGLPRLPSPVSCGGRTRPAMVSPHAGEGHRRGNPDPWNIQEADVALLT